MSAKRKPPGWRKALANVSVGVDAYVECSLCTQAPDRLGDRLWIAHNLMLAVDLCVEDGLDDGWTYDRDGNWTCPTCNKKGGE